MRWLIIHGTRESKISGGRWRFRSILAFRVRDMLSSHLILDIYALFQMVFDGLRVAVDVFEVVVDGFRWF